MAVPPCPPRQCPQCWLHAYDKSVHRALGGEDCGPCLDHMATNCRGFYAR